MPLEVKQHSKANNFFKTYKYQDKTVKCYNCHIDALSLEIIIVNHVTINLLFLLDLKIDKFYSFQIGDAAYP